MKLSRREIALAAVLAAPALSAVEAGAAASLGQNNRTEHGPRPSPDFSYFTKPKGGEYIAMVLYPGMTALDLIGPHYFFNTMRGAKVEVIAPAREPMACDRGLTLMPTATYADVPKDIDLLFVPGAGFGTLDAMKNDPLLDFLADRGSRGRFVTAVCTGPLILGAAGLLKGYRATTNWGVRDKVLPAVGAIPVDARYVVDRNRITGGRHFRHRFRPAHRHLAARGRQRPRQPTAGRVRSGPAVRFRQPAQGLAGVGGGG